MSNKPNKPQTNNAVLDGQSSPISLSQCPVCKTEYTQSEVNRCSVCNWDLTACPEAFLDRQNVQVAWARDMWVKLQTQQKQLHIKINAEIDANPQLSELRAESDLEIWNLLITWVCGVDLDAAKTAVERLQNRYQGKEPHQIARILILHKCCQAAGVELVKGIPAVNELLNGLVGVDLPIVTILSAEMIYQISAIYGLDIQAPERKLEVLAAFGVALLGERAIEVGLDWLKYGLMPGQLISASTKALMIYALGNAACLFYEAKVNQNITPLNLPAAFNVLRQKSQQYLENNTSEASIVKTISYEIETTPLRGVPPKPMKNHQKNKSNLPTKPKPSASRPKPTQRAGKFDTEYNRLRDLLAAGEWREADSETYKLMLKVVGQEKSQYLDRESIKKLPSKDLHIIDQLWLQYSNGCFGFSVQKRIWLSVGGNDTKFSQRVGWKIRSFMGMTFVDDIIYQKNAPEIAPMGHLPAEFGTLIKIVGLDKSNTINALSGMYVKYEFLLSRPDL